MVTFHRVCQQRRTGSPFQNWEVQQKVSMIQGRQTTFSPFDKPYHIVSCKVSENQTVISGCQSPPPNQTTHITCRLFTLLPYFVHSLSPWYLLADGRSLWFAVTGTRSSPHAPLYHSNLSVHFCRDA